MINILTMFVYICQLPLILFKFSKQSERIKSFANKCHIAIYLQSIGVITYLSCKPFDASLTALFSLVSVVLLFFFFNTLGNLSFYFC